MAVSAGAQMRFWGIGMAVFAALMWFLGGTLLPYIAGAAIAYLLDPLADALERRGMSRAWATALIVIGALLAFVLAMVLVVPALAHQIEALVDAIPALIEAAQGVLDRRFPDLLAAGSSLRVALASMEETIRKGGLAVLNTLLASSMKVIDFLMVLVITPVVAFYLLLDWDKMVARIDGWLPRQHADEIRDLARQIDAVLAGFVRGQLSVCAILGAFYAVALTLIGLPFGFLVGILAGLISFIPFVGAFVGGALSLGIALYSFWGDPVWIFATAAIFAAGQFVEGNILSPKLVGKSVGLHPVWLIFALSVFGSLFGFAGMLIAVPVSAALGVFGRFGIARYLASPLYTGVPASEDERGS